MYQHIRDLREDSDLTQQQLADYLNITQATYSRYESGNLDIPSSTLRAYPEIRRAQIAQQIFCCARRFDAGILCVFRVKSTRHSGKDASKMCADNFRIGSYSVSTVL